MTTVTEDDLSYTSFFTTFEDPMKLNTINLNLDYYADDSDVGGNFTYQRSVGSYKLGLSYSKSFSKSSLSSSNNFETNYLLSMRKEFSLNNSKVTAHTYVALSEAKTAFSSNDELKKVGASFVYGVFPTKRYSFFSGMQFYFGFSLNMPDSGEDYNRYQTSASYTMDLYRENMLTLSGTYENLDKDNFLNGIAYGGGTVKSIHNTYGVAYSDILGNEIWSLRAELDSPLWDIYKGYGLVPLYFSQLRGLLGYDYIGADFIFLNRSLFRNKNLTSNNIGLKLDGKFLYYVPFSIEMVYSDAKIEETTDDDFQFILRSEYTY